MEKISLNPTPEMKKKIERMSQPRIWYQYKRRTHKRRKVQTSDAQTSDQYKRRTSTFIRKNVGLGRFLMDHCFKKFQTMNSTRSYSLIPISLQPAVVDLKYFK